MQHPHARIGSVVLKYSLRDPVAEPKPMRPDQPAANKFSATAAAQAKGTVVVDSFEFAVFNNDRELRADLLVQLTEELAASPLPSMRDDNEQVWEIPRLDEGAKAGLAYTLGGLHAEWSVGLVRCTVADLYSTERWGDGRLLDQIEMWIGMRPGSTEVAQSTNEQKQLLVRGANYVIENSDDPTRAIDGIGHVQRALGVAHRVPARLAQGSPELEAMIASNARHRELEALGIAPPFADNEKGRLAAEEWSKSAEGVALVERHLGVTPGPGSYFDATLDPSSLPPDVRSAYQAAVAAIASDPEALGGAKVTPATERLGAAFTQSHEAMLAAIPRYPMPPILRSEKTTSPKTDLGFA